MWWARPVDPLRCSLAAGECLAPAGQCSASDSTIGDWFRAGCERLRPLYDALRQEVMSCDYIQVDESTLPVVSDEKRRAVKGYVWVVRNAVQGEVFFHYASGSRSHTTAKALLGGFRGAIQSDGYSWEPSPFSV